MTVEGFAEVDVSALASWVETIPEHEWRWFADPEWNGCAEVCRPVVAVLMKFFPPSCFVSGVGLFVLDAGQEHPAHRDEQAPLWVTRIHVPVVTNPLATATTDDGTFHMERGVAYMFNTRETHAVRNGGSRPRVHLVFDVMRSING